MNGIASNSGGRALVGYFAPWRHTSILWQLTRREIQARYRRNLLGWVWLIVSPLAMLLVLTFVFRQVMGVRWAAAGGDSGDLDFALRILAGLALYQWAADCIVRAPRLIVSQPQLVKKVVFPVELLAWVSVAGSGVGFAASAGLLLLGTASGPSGLPLSALALPLVWAPTFVLLLGLSWLLSGLGTYLPDLAEILPPLVSALMFLSPVLYPVEALPPIARTWMDLNPIALPINETRALLFEGRWPDWGAWSLHALACAGVAIVGATLFARIRGGFSDVV